MFLAEELKFGDAKFVMALTGLKSAEVGYKILE
jgi:hypothetical protein